MYACYQKSENLELDCAVNKEMSVQINRELNWIEHPVQVGSIRSL